LGLGFWKVGMGGVLCSSGKKLVLPPPLAGVVFLVVFVQSRIGVVGAMADVEDLFFQRRTLAESRLAMACTLLPVENILDCPLLA
jgi:hypothetical protein